MPENFDPYTNWFGIAENEQPPSHYRLLGLSEFEPETERIREAGENRTQFLQDVSSGKNVEHAQRLLNEVARAVVCLTDAEKKSAYDSQLRNGTVAQPKFLKKAQANAAKAVSQTAASGSTTNPVQPSGAKRATAKRTSRKPAQRTAKSKARTTPTKSRAQSKNKAKFPVWGYFVTMPVLLAATFGAFMLLKSKADGTSKGGVEYNKDWESGKTVSAVFANAKAADRKFDSSAGSWELGKGVVFNSNKKRGPKFLHLSGGKNRIVTLKLSQKVDRKGLMTVELKRWSTKVKFTLKVQQSANGSDWKKLPEADYSGKPPSGRDAGQSWSMICELSDPKTQFIRFVCDSREYANKKDGGLLVERMTIAPSLH
jgi:hypothetical protein